MRLNRGREIECSVDWGVHCKTTVHEPLWYDNRRVVSRLQDCGPSICSTSNLCCVCTCTRGLDPRTQRLVT